MVLDGDVRSYGYRDKGLVTCCFGASALDQGSWRAGPPTAALRDGHCCFHCADTETEAQRSRRQVCSSHRQSKGFHLPLTLQVQGQREMPAASPFSIFKIPSELDSCVSVHVSWFLCRQSRHGLCSPEASGGVTRPQLLRVQSVLQKGREPVPSLRRHHLGLRGSPSVLCSLNSK